tara:strand:+ start:266 stop:421 length:156 start_codon:yes stop_codon:yes gene_type:complete
MGDDISEIMSKLGGTGKYQITWLIIVATGMLSGGFINYSLYYFTLEPIYLC